MPFSSIALKPDEKGRVIATANVVNTLGMMCSAGVANVCQHYFNMSAAGIIALAGVMTLLAAVASFQIAPNFVRVVGQLVNNIMNRSAT